MVLRKIQTNILNDIGFKTKPWKNQSRRNEN